MGKRQPTAAFSYYGGKKRMASRIVPLLPKHATYVEPFAGGLAVLFAKPRHSFMPNHDYREVVNDTNTHIVNFFRVLQQPDGLERLLHRLAYTPYARAEFYRAKAFLEGEIMGSDLDLAWAWLVNIEMSFAKTSFGGWGYALTSENGAMTWQRRVRRIEQVAERLSGVFILNIDALDCIQKWDSPHTCFYVDPPYVGTNQGHYGGYTQEQFDSLLATLDTIQGSVVLSSYANESLENYPHWQRYAFDAVASALGTGRTGKRDKTRKATAEELGDNKRTELVHVIDRSHAMRREAKESVYRQSQGTFWP